MWCVSDVWKWWCTSDGVQVMCVSDGVQVVLLKMYSTQETNEYMA